MPFSNQEVNNFYEEIVSGRQAAKASMIRPMSNPRQLDVLPEIIYQDRLGEAISIPVAGNSDRDIYVRRHGQPWQQVLVSPFKSNDPLSSFAAPGVIEGAVHAVEIAEKILMSLGHGTKETVQPAVRSAFGALNREGAIISVDALVRRCLG